MQSQLEAALLGHTNNSIASAQNEDDNNFAEDGEDDIEELIDEDIEEDNGHRPGKISIGSSSTPRTVTLQMLLAADILQPGPGYMTIEYLGQRFVGDLLEDGKIRSQETDLVFASPSAWAIACKRFINPDKKSGCGWASVKYRGRKLDAYKNVWYKKKKEEQNQEKEINSESETITNNMSNSTPYHRVVVKHNTIANRTLTHDANTLIECVPFSNLGKIQPFLISLSTNAALLMDFHCHLLKTEVCGYLGGHWDVNTHNLQVTHAFPCKSMKSDKDNATQVEMDISKVIEKDKLTLVGWYHSHPFSAASPTLRDIDAQLDYQIKMKGVSDNNYTPCIGIIISPYNYENNSVESSITAYWVIPPPETKPNEYGRPMLMSYSVIQDPLLTQNVKDEMKKCVEYYKKESDFINLSDRYLNNTFYIDKLKGTLVSKLPRDESEISVWRFIREILGYPQEDNDNLLSIPTVNKSTYLPTTLNSNLMLPTDISSILYNSGKFPSASSLLGLPDPMAHSTLAANNMFLSTNLFKMQELLKPLSTSSPLPPSKSKTSPTLKIPAAAASSTTAIDSKNLKNDFTSDLMNLKNFIQSTTSTTTTSSSSSSSNNNNTTSSNNTIDNITMKNKIDFSVSDLSISSYKIKDNANDFSLNLMKNNSGEKPSKIFKNDFTNMLDLSLSKKNDEPTDLSKNLEHQNISDNDDKPLNLITDN